MPVFELKGKQVKVVGKLIEMSEDDFKNRLNLFGANLIKDSGKKPDVIIKAFDASKSKAAYPAGIPIFSEKEIDSTFRKDIPAETKTNILDDLLSQSPSRSHWEKICLLFHLWEPSTALDQAILKAKEGTKMWPLKICRHHPSDWIVTLLEGKIEPRLQILRSIEIDGEIDESIDDDETIQEFNQNLERFIDWLASDQAPSFEEIKISSYYLNASNLENLGIALINHPLTSLTFLYCSFIEDAWNKFEMWPEFGFLTHFEVQSFLFDKGLVPLLKGQFLSTVTHLSLRNAGLVPSGLKAIGSCPFLSKLESLNLSANELKNTSSEDLKELLEGKPHLLAINFDQSHMGPKSMDAFAQCSEKLALQKLNLSRNGLGPEGANLFAKAKNLDQLKHLSLEANRIGTEAACTVFKNLPLEKIETLSLFSNDLGSEAIEVLVNNPSVKNIQILDVHFNKIGDRGLAALVQSQYLSQLKELYIGRNGISSKWAELLSDNKDFPSIETLSFETNKLGKLGAAALFIHPIMKTVQYLNLADNNITDEGLKEILSVPPPSKLKFLNLRANGLSNDGLSLLANSQLIQQLDDLQISTDLFHYSADPYDKKGVMQFLKERNIPPVLKGKLKEQFKGW